MLRPDKLSEIIGQEKVKETLDIICSSAKQRADCIEHTLFFGEPGLGKTTLARAVANEMDADIQIANAANVGQMKNMLPYVMRMDKGSVLFIDEIHRLPSKTQEFLFPVMEDYRVDLSDGKTTESIELPKFTLIGATTEGGSLLPPLRDRFSHKIKLELYSVEELVELGQRNVSKLNISIETDALRHLAKMARGVPRLMNARLSWMRDFNLANGIPKAKLGDVTAALRMVGVDENGLTEQDRKYLTVLAETVTNTGNAVGLNTLVASTGLSKDDILNVVEPYLLRQGIIYRTAKGRVIGEMK